MLYLARDAIRGQSALTPLSVDLSILHHGYRPSAFWFELVETSRKLILTGFLSIFYPGTILQLYVGLLIAFSLLIAQAWCSPYRKATDNFFAVVSAAGLAFVLLAELGLRADAADGVGAEQAALLIGALCVASSVDLVLALGYLAHGMASDVAVGVLRWKADDSIVEPPGVNEGESHFFLSHQWGTGQDQMRVLKQRIL